MKEIDLAEVKRFVETNIEEFHNARLKAMANTDLKGLLKKKNPALLHKSKSVA